MPILDPNKRKKLVKKSPGIPTQNANPTPKAGPKNSIGKGPKGNSTKTSQRFNRAMLYRARGEKII